MHRLPETRTQGKVGTGLRLLQLSRACGTPPSPPHAPPAPALPSLASDGRPSPSWCPAAAGSPQGRKARRARQWERSGFPNPGLASLRSPSHHLGTRRVIGQNRNAGSAPRAFCGGPAVRGRAPRAQGRKETGSPRDSRRVFVKARGRSPFRKETYALQHRTRHRPGRDHRCPGRSGTDQRRGPSPGRAAGGGRGRLIWRRSLAGAPSTKPRIRDSRNLGWEGPQNRKQLSEARGSRICSRASKWGQPSTAWKHTAALPTPACTDPRGQCVNKRTKSHGALGTPGCLGKCGRPAPQVTRKLKNEGGRHREKERGKKQGQRSKGRQGRERHST